jgi:hypothetical protein
MIRFILLFFLLQTTSFAECGKLVTAVFNYNSKSNTAKLEYFFKFNEEFCDAGKNEINANVSVALLDINQKIIEEKRIYFPKFVIAEKMNKKDPNVFEKTHISKGPQYINLKFSIFTDVSKIKFYKIVELEGSKIIGSGEIK